MSNIITQEDMDILSHAKKLYLPDGVNYRDEADIKPKSLITIRDGVGNILHKKLHNKVTVAGSAYTAAKHYNITPSIVTPTYNASLSLDNTIADDFTEPGIRRSEQVILWAIGVGGCGASQSQVYDVKYAGRISPTNLVPFRYIPAGTALTALERASYFGQKTLSDYIAYYFKAFDTDPAFVQRYVDGTPIDANVYTSTNTLDVESFIQLKLKVTTDDCREYFKAIYGNLDEAKVNTLSLLTAYPTVIGDYTFYQNIRPLTQLNFPSEPLNEYTKSLDITYLTFY